MCVLSLSAVSRCIVKMLPARGVQDPGGTPWDFFPIKSRFGFHPGGQSPNRRFLLGASAGPCPPPGPKRRCFGWSPTLEDVDIAWSGSRFKAKLTVRRQMIKFNRGYLVVEIETQQESSGVQGVSACACGDGGSVHAVGSLVCSRVSLLGF